MQAKNVLQQAAVAQEAALRRLADAYAAFVNAEDAVIGAALGENRGLTITSTVGVSRVNALLARRLRSLGLGAVLEHARTPGGVGETWAEDLSAKIGALITEDIEVPSVSFGVGYDVKADFGARGDGTGNDAPAFQDAHDALDDDFGGLIIVPPGRYRFEEPLFLTKKYVTLQCYARFSAWLQLANGVNATMIQAGTGGAYMPGLTIRGLYLQGNSANQSGTSHGLSIDGCEYPVIEDCQFRDFLTDGVNVSAEDAFRTIYARLQRCYLNTNKRNGVTVGQHCYGFELFGNIIAGNGQTGADNPPIGYGAFFSEGDNHHIGNGNLFDENGHGCAVQACSDFLIDNNRFQNQRGSAVLAGISGKNGGIRNNMILNVGSHAADTYFGIFIQHLNHLSVIGNTIRSSNKRMSHAIQEAGSSDFNTFGKNTIETADALNTIVTVGADSIVSDDNPGA